MRVLWITLCAGLACNSGADDRASSDGQELSSDIGSSENTTSVVTGDQQPREDIAKLDASASTEGERDDSAAEESMLSTRSDSGIEAGDGTARMACEALDAQTCRAQQINGCVPIQGLRYVEKDACAESRFVACTCARSALMSCSSSCSDNGAIRYMQDDQNALWMFPTTCTPEGWQQVASDDPSVSVFQDVTQCAAD